MDKLLDGGLAAFFDHVYLIDLSPSLCQVARDRVERLGWSNVTVLCQDARTVGSLHSQPRTADLITMSYSLSMIPDFYSVVDRVTHLLAPRGIVGICDFYVQVGAAGTLTILCLDHAVADMLTINTESGRSGLPQLDRRHSQSSCELVRPYVLAHLVRCRSSQPRCWPP